MKRKHRLSNCPVVENGVDVYDAPITSELAAQTLCTAPTSLDKKDYFVQPYVRIQS